MAKDTVTMKATRAFSGSQTSAANLGRIESDEVFEATAEDAEYLARNGFAHRVEDAVTTPEAEGEDHDTGTTSTAKKKAPRK